MIILIRNLSTEKMAHEWNQISEQKENRGMVKVPIHKLSLSFVNNDDYFRFTYNFRMSSNYMNFSFCRKWLNISGLWHSMKIKICDQTRPEPGRVQIIIEFVGFIAKVRCIFFHYSKSVFERTKSINIIRGQFMMQKWNQLYGIVV